MFGLTEQELNCIIETFEKFPDIQEVILYGSRAKGTQKVGSDVDLALKGELKSKTVPDLLDLLNEESPLPYFFDVLDYETLTNTKLKEHIDRVGKTIYSS